LRDFARRYEQLAEVWLRADEERKKQLASGRIPKSFPPQIDRDIQSLNIQLENLVQSLTEEDLLPRRPPGYIRPETET
jgi:hypothetical protein